MAKTVDKTSCVQVYSICIPPELAIHMNTLQVKGVRIHKAEGHCSHVNYLWSIQINTVLDDFRTYCMVTCGIFDCI